MGKIEYGGLKETGKILVQEKYIWIEFKKITTIKPFCLLRGWQKKQCRNDSNHCINEKYYIKGGYIKHRGHKKEMYLQYYFACHFVNDRCWILSDVW